MRALELDKPILMFPDTAGDVGASKVGVRNKQKLHATYRNKLSSLTPCCVGSHPTCFSQIIGRRRGELAPHHFMAKILMKSRKAV